MTETGSPRPATGPILVADNRKAREVLGWRPQYDLGDIVRSAWDWHARFEETVLPEGAKRGG